MDTVERRDRQSNTSLYNILFKDGFKRAVFLLLILSFLNIVYVIFCKLSENNLNKLFGNFFSRVDDLSKFNIKTPKNFSHQLNVIEQKFF